MRVPAWGMSTGELRRGSRDSSVAADAAPRLRGRAARPSVDDAAYIAESMALPPGWAGVLARLPVTPTQLLRAAHRAAAHSTGFLAELLAVGAAPESHVYAAMAAELGVDFVEHLDPKSLAISDRDCFTMLRGNGSPKPVFAAGPAGIRLVVLAPDERQFDQLHRRLVQSPDLARRIRITAPGELRRALRERSAPQLMSRAKYRLFDALPVCSSIVTANGWQIVAIGVCLSLLPLLQFMAPVPVVLAFHALVSLSFMSCVALRLAAWAETWRLAWRLPQLEPDPHCMPVYSVLVALRDEADMVPELLRALAGLKWPRSRLDIKLICEADDGATLEAIRAYRLPPCVEVMEIPKAEPRTKPKALAYALPLARGEFVVLYDAEDKPHPDQLLEAWRCFSAADSTLACVQAPLVVVNGGSSMLTRMFAFEYAALFRGLLPFLARHKLVVPLGGTSNHFRGLM